MSLSDVLDSCVPFALPLRHRFRGLTVREGVLIPGPSGWGEFAPFDDYTAAASARWLDCALEAAYGQWPAPVREEVPVNAIIPAVPGEQAASMVLEAVRSWGCRTVKVKVGAPDLGEDDARVAAVREALDSVLGPGVGSIRIDANGAWSTEQARAALAALGVHGLEYVEQPCRGWDELASLRRHVEVPVAVDETIRLSVDPVSLRVSDIGDIADIAVLKVAPLGGVAATLEVADAVGVPVVISGSLDSSVGLDSGVAAAAALPDLTLACGLGTGALLADDVAPSRLPRGGVIPVGRTVPDDALLASARQRLEAGPGGAKRAERWRQRIAAAWAVKG